MNPKSQRPPDGEIRQSQVVTTFGPGAMMDLPNHSVIIGGLEQWRFPLGERNRVDEPRLQSRVAELLQRPDVALYKPPVNLEDPRSPFAGMNAFIFPTWFLAQTDQEFEDPISKRRYRTRPLVTWSQLTEGKWLNQDKKKVEVVPVRFVQACQHGHISDINWYAFVYRDWSARRKGLLWLDEGGAGNDFADIWVRCEETRVRRQLGDAKIPAAKALGSCNGLRPWLGAQNREPGCEQATRLLVRSATNAYFSQTLGVISIPDLDAELRDAVSGVWEDFLQYCESEADVARERKKARVHSAIEKYSNATVWAHVQVRLSPEPPTPKGIKQVEIETLLGQPDSVGEDRPEGDFYARNRPLPSLPAWLSDRLDRVVLVHRLREVVAQVGFTRFEPEEPDIDGMLNLDVKRGALALENSWVPAIENKGEGVLITFRAKMMEEWLRRPAVEARIAQLMAGQQANQKRKGELATTISVRATVPYMMLHSLSHLLITAVSLECGYSASSIRERIYASSSGYGILLYTGTPGAEGTLGGLVQVGTHIEQHLTTALEIGRLCSNDPVCAYHRPDDGHEERFLHGAACHGCLLIAETSCERRNELLDRALVVPTVHTPGAAFFERLP